MTVRTDLGIQDSTGIQKRLCFAVAFLLPVFVPLLEGGIVLQHTLNVAGDIDRCLVGFLVGKLDKA